MLDAIVLIYQKILIKYESQYKEHTREKTET